MRDHAEIDVGPQRHPDPGDFLFWVATFHQQRRPLLNLSRVLRGLNTVEQRILDQRLLALVQVSDVVIVPDEAHVRGRVDEVAGLAQATFLHLVRPKLARNLEFFGNAYHTLCVDAAIGQLRRVVQFGESGMAGSGIILAVRAFPRNTIRVLIEPDVPVWLQLTSPG